MYSSNSKIKKKVTFILAAAGQGKRMNLNSPKQFLDYKGEPLFYSSLKLAFENKNINDIIIIFKNNNINIFFLFIILIFSFIINSYLFYYFFNILRMFLKKPTFVFLVSSFSFVPSLSSFYISLKVYSLLIFIMSSPK